MLRNLLALTALTFLVFASTPSLAQSHGAHCGSFKKTSDGRWTVIKPIRIAHGTGSVVLLPGTIITPTTRAAGADVYAALQKSCH